MENFQKFFLIFGFLTISGFTVAQVPGTGRCPEVNVQEDFNVTKYMGVWYEIKRYPFIFETGKCQQAVYSLNDDETVSVTNSQRDFSSNAVTSTTGVAKVIAPGKLFVQFFKPNITVEEKPNYLILYTDYSSISCIYSCTQVDDSNYYNVAWILAKERTISDEILTKAQQYFTDNNISLNPFLSSVQDNCSA